VGLRNLHWSRFVQVGQVGPKQPSRRFYQDHGVLALGLAHGARRASNLRDVLIVLIVLLAEHARRAKEKSNVEMPPSSIQDMDDMDI
jgi:hypothetical protein